MVHETSAAIKLDGAISVADFKVKILRAVFAGDRLGQIEKMRTKSLLAMGRFDEEFIDPSPFASIFGAIVKTDDKVGDGVIGVRYEINEAVYGVLKEFAEIRPNDGFVERL